jgi:hypothetical protein
MAGLSARHLAVTSGDKRPFSAPARAIDRTATIHGCPWGANAGGHHGSRDRSWAQHDSGPYDATGRILNVLTVHHGTGLFRACGYEASYQQAC